MDRDQLLFLALCTMSEAAENAGSDPIQISLGVRLAVAYAALFAPKDRKPFDAFWTVFREPLEGLKEADRAYARKHSARRCLYTICRAVGIEPTIGFQLELANARDPERRDRVRMANAIKAAADERGETSENARRGRHCEIDRPPPLDDQNANAAGSSPQPDPPA